MNYREFVDHVKKDVEVATAELVLLPDVHFMKIEGETDCPMVKIPTIAFVNPKMRLHLWTKTIVPLMHVSEASKIALIFMGLVFDPETLEPTDRWEAAISIADAERTEAWTAPVIHDHRSFELGEWEGPSLDPLIPDFHILEEALR